MASKLEDQVASYLNNFIYNNYPDLHVDREVPGDFGIRYDFVIPTSPPICIEVDGENHRSYNDFFFKTSEDFDKYKDNDNIRIKLHHAGNIILINVPDNQKWTYSKFKNLFNDYEDVLEKGITESAKKARQEKFAKIESFKEKNKEWKEKQKVFEREQYEKQKEYVPELDEEQEAKKKKYRKEQLEKQRKYRKEQYKKLKEKTAKK